MVQAKCTWVLGVVALSAAVFGCGEPELTDKYPYTLEDGAIACADGDSADRPVEYYYFDRIAELLREDEALATYARLNAIGAIDSCETARHFAAVHRRYVDLQGSGDEDPDAIPDEMSDAAGVDYESAEEPVEKIAEGFVPGDNLMYTVRLDNCSGVLVSPNWMLTAAHCFPADGPYRMYVFLREKPINDGHIWVVRHPAWSGVLTDGKDLAMIWSSGWLPPADREVAWRRIFGRQLYTGSLIAIHGYGRTNHDGGEAGTWRRSQNTITTDYSSTGLIGMRTRAGEGRPCKGDSGGPAITQRTLYPFVTGVASYHENGSNFCPYTGDRFYYTQVGGGTTQACRTGGLASSRSCWVQDTINLDPWTPDDCTRGTWANYSYLQCW